MTTQHKVGTEQEWRAASDELLAREKEHMRMGDELAAARRALPWVPVEKDYVFQTADGEKTLVELFDGRSQLLVYHFMYGPDDTDGCVGCSFLSDHLDGAIPHVHARDITVKIVSRGPLERLHAYRERMGWQFDWVSSEGSDYGFDVGVSSDEGEVPKLIAYALEDGVVYKTYEATARGLEAFDGAYHLIDRAPKGRQEDEYEYFPGEWWKRHDEYEGVTV